MPFSSKGGQGRHRDRHCPVALDQTPCRVGLLGHICEDGFGARMNGRDVNRGKGGKFLRRLAAGPVPQLLEKLVDLLDQACLIAAAPLLRRAQIWQSDGVPRSHFRS